MPPGNRPTQWVERVTLDGAIPTTAREWGERLFGPRPVVVRALIAVRNLVVRPFGIEPFGARASHSVQAGPAFLGPFPVIDETPTRIDFGITDKHLSFRSSLVVTEHAHATLLEVTTTVTTHNTFGQLYAGALRLGHPLIMRLFLRRLHRRHANRS